jgi:hypothetical protein
MLGLVCFSAPAGQGKLMILTAVTKYDIASVSNDSKSVKWHGSYSIFELHPPSSRLTRPIQYYPFDPTPT